MNRREIVGGLLLGGVTAAFGGCATAPAPNTAPISEALAATTTPGVTAIVIRDFRAGPELVAGVRAVGNADRVTPGQRWHLGSDGKAMTATLVARLVEARVLAWDRPLSVMLPDLAEAMQPAYRDVTLPDLLSHRAGLPENTADMALFATFYDDPAPLSAQRLRYIAACLREAPVGPARAARSYSNTGYIIAGACAEHAAGRAFEDLIMSQVFAPLAMRSVSFEQFGAPGEPQGHVDGRVADHQRDANPHMFAPAGGMRMTMNDWARFCIDHMQGEHGRGHLLRTDTYRFLHAGQGDTGAALGWGAAPHPMNLRGPALTHSGSDGNWYALVCLFPQTGNGVLVAANAAESMHGDRVATTLMHTLARTVAAPLPDAS